MQTHTGGTHPLAATTALALAGLAGLLTSYVVLGIAVARIVQLQLPVLLETVVSGL
jgi:hypothetical protein